MFTNAKKVAAVNPAAPKAKAKITHAVDALDGYAEVAALDTCIKQLTGLLELKKAPIKEAVIERLISRGIATKLKPNTMYPADGGAGGSASLTRRGSNRALAAAEVEVLAELFELPIGEDGGLAIPGITETREKQPALLAVNPAYAHDELLLARIDKALQGVKGVPEDFIVQQDPVIETIVSETALDRIFSYPAAVVPSTIEIIAGLVFRPVFKDMMRAWEMVIEMIGQAAKSPPADKKPAAAPTRRIA
jgi:hypothetical protein